MQELGFRPSVADAGLYIKEAADGTRVLLLTYVDDFLMTGPPTKVEEVVQGLQARLDVRDLGEAKTFLNMQISRNWEDKTVLLHMRQQVDDLLQLYGMQDCDITFADTPLPAGYNPTDTKNAASEPLDDKQLSAFRQLIGSLNYLAYNPCRYFLCSRYVV